jgi:hypothetical protein
MDADFLSSPPFRPWKLFGFGVRINVCLRLMCCRSPVIGLLRGHFGFLDRARLRRYTFLVLGGLKANPLPWLLGEDDPSIRYFTLVDILDAPPQDRRVVAAKKAIMEKGIVPKILAKQKKADSGKRRGTSTSGQSTQERSGS